MKVYVVSDGRYSEYHICGVFSTPEKAAVAKRLHASSNGVETWELDALPDHPEGMFGFMVYMDAEGNSDVRACSSDYLNSKNVPGLYAWRPRGPKRVEFTVWARDEQHAVKIANERRVQLIESGQWTTDWDVYRVGGGKDV